MSSHQSIQVKVILGYNDSGRDISEFITKLKFKRSIKREDMLELTAEGEDAEKILEMNEFAPGKPILFSYGYIAGQMSPPRVAIIGDIEPEYEYKGGVTLQISSVEAAINMRYARSNKIWNNKRSDQIIGEIAAAHNLRSIVIARDANAPLENNFTTYAALPQANMSSMEFIQYLAGREKSGDYIVFVQDDIVYYTPMDTNSKSKDIINVMNSENVQKFSIKYKEIHQDENAAGATTKVVDPKTGTVLGDIQVTAMTIAIANGINEITKDPLSYKDTLGHIVVVPANQVIYIKDPKGKIIPFSYGDKLPLGTLLEYPNGKMIIETGDQDTTTAGGAPVTEAASHPSDEAQQKTTATQTRAKQKVLTASLVEYGEPTRRINEVLTITGIATRYLGNWYIEEIEDEVTEHTYMTTSNLMKTGLHNGEGAKATKSNDTEGNKDDATKIQINVSGRSNTATVEDLDGNPTSVDAGHDYITKYKAPGKPSTPTNIKSRLK